MDLLLQFLPYRGLPVTDTIIAVFQSNTDAAPKEGGKVRARDTLVSRSLRFLNHA